MDERKKRLRDIIAEKSFSIGGDFKLASGQSSGFYFDMKPTVMDPEGARLTGERSRATRKTGALRGS